MNNALPCCAIIISALNVEDEAMKAFYTSLTHNKSIDDYILEKHLHFSSCQIEGAFFSHLLAYTELALDSGGAIDR
ncbi:hypothetical protein [Candidatus Sororendozoicomonas aggregata]|uniref:hypothetical protein n=1 Tax=Candidatus Sororendozoicomonas aggregata TaxID=3073239 RepID=UPI002ED2896B